MRSTDILIKEHRAIETVLGVMERAAKRLETDGQVDPSLLADCLDFASGFADRCHHAKEEDLLLPRLEQRGMNREGGPIEYVLSDHEKGRGFIKAAKQALDEWRGGDDSARMRLAAALRGYAGLLRIHIQKEDSVLFEEANHLLSEEDDSELEAAFDEVEERKIGPGVHEAYHRMLDGLEERAKDL